MNTYHYFHFKDRYVLFLFMRTDCKQCNATWTVVSQVTVFPTAVNRHILKKKRNKRMASFPSLVGPKPYIPMVSLHFNQ